MAFSLIVPVDEIPEAGLVLQGQLPQEWVAQSLLAAYRTGSEVDVTLLAKRYNDNVHVEGRVKLTLGFDCSRTLAPGELKLDLPISELYQPASKSHVNLGDGVDAEALEDELHTYEGNKIDLEPRLREEIVLAQEPYPTVSAKEADDESPAWSSTSDDVDPRWAKLKDLKLN